MQLHKFGITNRIWDDLMKQNENIDMIQNAFTLLQTGYRYVQTLYYTNDGTFEKDNYPWLRAIRVKVQAGGGGGGGADATGPGAASMGAGGGGGGYAESFLTVDALAASEIVTVGAGGAGGTGANNGSKGGNSSFGSLVVAEGGAGGGYVSGLTSNATFNGGGAGGVGIAGQLLTGGTAGEGATRIPLIAFGGTGGSSMMGGGGRGGTTNANGASGQNYGGGGGGARNHENQATERTGGAGAPGIVIVELYA